MTPPSASSKATPLAPLINSSAFTKNQTRSASTFDKNRGSGANNTKIVAPSYSLGVHDAKVHIDRVIQGKDYRDIAMTILANEFLNSRDISLDMRAYLVETVLPTTILALEKLLMEAERKGALEMVEESRKSIVAKLVAEEEGAAPAAEETGLEAQIDKPIERPLDPLNWTAQFLYRNNPRYANFSDINSSPYHQHMSVISRQLKARLFEMRMNQMARKRAEELASRREQERELQVYSQRMEERKNLTIQLLITIFKRWIGKLWRFGNGLLFKNEIIKAFKAAWKSAAIQSNDTLIEKVAEVINKISLTYEDSLTAPLQGDSKQLPPELLSVERWDQNMFVEGMMLATHNSGWSIDELSAFLQPLSTIIDEIGETMQLGFDRIYFCPSFGTTTSKEQWRNKLKKLVFTIEVDSESYPNYDSFERIKSSLIDFCSGNIELGVESSSRVSRASKSPGSTTVEDEIDAEFKMFVKMMAGIHGIESVAQVLNEIKKKMPAPEQLSKPKPVQETKQEADTIPLDLPKPHDIEARTQSLKMLLQSLDEFGVGQVKASTYNRIIDNLLENDELGLTDNERASFTLLKIQSSLTKTIGEDGSLDIDQLSVLVAGQTTSIGNKVFDKLLGWLKSGIDGVIAANARAREAKLASVENATSKTKTELSRAEIQRQALEEIKKASRNMDYSIADAAEVSLNAVATALKHLHPDHSILGRVTLRELQIAKAQAENVKASLDELLRVVAATSELRPQLLGTTLPTNSGYEAQVLEEQKTVKISHAESDPASPAGILSPGSPLLSPGGTVQYLGVPFVGSTKKPVGVIGLSLAGQDDGGFADADVKFVETASAVMLSTFDKIEARLKAISLAESSAHWASAKGNAEVEIYLNEPESWTDPPHFFKLDHKNEPASPANESPQSPYMKAVYPRVIPIPEDRAHDLLVQTHATKEMINFKEEDGRSSTYIPIIDETNHVVAAMRIRPHVGTPGQVPDEDVLEVKKVLTVLENCLNHVHKEKFGHNGDLTLAGEMIDDESRRKLLFPKMMLISARDLLGKLDNRALSELRSYKKPPATIHRVIKSVLYIFGKFPKEVKKWADAVKCVNTDLIKTMIEYDPTAVQKKIRFKRCDRVMKLIPHGEVRQRGSLPALFMYDWVLVTLELRKRAVEARQRRQDVFTTPEEPAGAEADDDDDDEGASSAGATLSRSNSEESLKERPASGHSGKEETITRRMVVGKQWGEQEEGNTRSSLRGSLTVLTGSNTKDESNSNQKRVQFSDSNS